MYSALHLITVCTLVACMAASSLPFRDCGRYSFSFKLQINNLQRSYNLGNLYSCKCEVSPQLLRLSFCKNHVDGQLEIWDFLPNYHGQKKNLSVFDEERAKFRVLYIHHSIFQHPNLGSQKFNSLLVGWQLPLNTPLTQTYIDQTQRFNIFNDGDECFLMVILFNLQLAIPYIRGDNSYL